MRMLARSTTGRADVCALPSEENIWPRARFKIPYHPSQKSVECPHAIPDDDDAVPTFLHPTQGRDTKVRWPPSRTFFLEIARLGLRLVRGAGAGPNEEPSGRVARD